MPTIAATVVETPVGTLVVVSGDDGILATTFDEGDGGVDRELETIEAALGAGVTPAADRGSTRLRNEVDGYFAGRPGALRSPVDLRLGGSGFARRVLEATMRIPFGEMVTYGDVADMAGSPRAARAAGNALARCPIELWVPCHRVVHADGHIGGYGRHEERKRFLLRVEGSIDGTADPSGPRPRTDVSTLDARH